jgi:transposase
MHSIETRNTFLKLRVQGWSFARISAHIGVSKPTLIDWSRRRSSEIQAFKRSETERHNESLHASSDAEAARLTISLNSLKQELLSRDLRSVSTEQLESTAADLERQLSTLRVVKKTCLAAHSTPLLGEAGKGW